MVVEVDAAAVWAVWAEVERWPDWTESVRRIEPLDGPELEVGRRFRIEQPRLPKLVWEVTALDEGAGWTWQTRSVGAITTAAHEVAPFDEGRSRVRQRFAQEGVLGAAMGLLTRPMTERYLKLEREGLKRRCEGGAEVS